VSRVASQLGAHDALVARALVAGAANASHALPEFTKASKRQVATAAANADVKKLLLPNDQFGPRHLGPSLEQVDEMCALIGVKDLNELMEQAIPAVVRRETKLESLPSGEMGEAAALVQLKEILSKNVVAKSFVGMGYHGSQVPLCILRNLTENAGWYTAYTPYQAEISQGRLESLMNFQTMVSELTGMECANASLLDEGTAAAEAMAMISRTVNSKTKKSILREQQRASTDARSDADTCRVLRHGNRSWRLEINRLLCNAETVRCNGAVP